MREMSRRCRVFFVSEDVFWIFISKVDVRLHLKSRIPVGAKLGKTVYDPLRGGYLLFMTCAEYPIAEPGTLPPIENLAMEASWEPWPQKELVAREVLRILGNWMVRQLKSFWRFLRAKFQCKPGGLVKPKQQALAQRPNSQSSSTV